ncbi:MAG: hypothetical protein WC306_03725, partial [Candidatus Paceibacterota bacterium]
ASGTYKVGDTFTLSTGRLVRIVEDALTDAEKTEIAQWMKDHESELKEGLVFYLSTGRKVTVAINTDWQESVEMAKARADLATAQSNLPAAQSAYDAAKATYDQLVAAKASGSGSTTNVPTDAEIDAAKADMDSKETALTTLKNEIKRLEEYIAQMEENSVGGTAKYIAKPETIVAKPETVVARPETIIAKPETIVAKPETIVAKPETIVAKPETIVAKPETIVAKPETIVAKPETIVAKPETIVAKPETIVAKPETIIAEPETIVAKPETIVARPETIVAEPETIVAKPETIVARPETIIAEPETIVAKPETIVAMPETIVAEPETIIAEPETIVAKPETIVAMPETIVAEPETIVAKPETIVAMPETIVAEPETIVAKPETIVAMPETIVAEPETIIAEPETIVARPETIIAEPETIVAKPETILYAKQWWPLTVEWKNAQGQVVRKDVYEYSQQLDVNGYVAGYGTYMKYTYKINADGDWALFTESSYDQTQDPNILKEVKLYNIDTGALVFDDVLVDNISPDELKKFAENNGVDFEERQDDLNNRFNEFVNSLGEDASFSVYKRIISPLGNTVYLLYDGYYNEPRVSISSSKIEFCYPEGTGAEDGQDNTYSFDIDTYFPVDGEYYTGASKVTVENGKIYIDGQEYEIRGVTVSTASVGEERKDFVLDSDSLTEEDVKDMAEAGINTVRTYYPPSGELLDIFADNNIRVIVGIPYYDDRNSPGPDIASGSYLKYIEAYKDHPAILAWEFGNEYNYHPEYFNGGTKTWYAALEEAAKATKAIDSNHLVSTAYGYDDVACSLDDGKEELATAIRMAPSVDIWGLNIYNWDDISGTVDNFKALANEVSGGTFNKAIYISETGSDSWNQYTGKEDQEAQANTAVNIYNTLKDSGTLGVTFMTWQDEWWKGNIADKQNTTGATFRVSPDSFGNEEYFGWVDVNGNYKKVYYAMQELWSDKKVLPVVTGEEKALDSSYRAYISSLDSSSENALADVSVVYTYYKVSVPSRDYQPTVGTITYMLGEDSAIAEIAYYDAATGKTRTFNLSGLNKFGVYLSDGTLTGYVYRESGDVFGRTVISAALDMKEIYLVTTFQDDNVYQPKNAVVLKWNDDTGRYEVAKRMVSQADFVNINDIYNFTDAEKEDIRNVISQIKGEEVEDVNTESLVKTETFIDGESYFVYSVPGDELGRSIIIDRESTVFVTQSFIDSQDIVYEGYFIDRDTGDIVLEIKNTDDKDIDYGLGLDDESRYYRVRCTNPNTGEVWYRWYYASHIWGGWAYEETGHFEKLDVPYTYIDNMGNTVNVTQRWVPETRTWVDQWSDVRDEAVISRTYNIVNGEEELFYSSEITGGKTLSEILSEDARQAILAVLKANGISDADKQLLLNTEFRVEKRTYADATGKSGKVEYYYYLPNDPVRGYAIMKDADHININIEWSNEKRGYERTFEFNNETYDLTGKAYNLRIEIDEKTGEKIRVYDTEYTESNRKSVVQIGLRMNGRLYYELNEDTVFGVSRLFSSPVMKVYYDINELPYETYRVGWWNTGWKVFGEDETLIYKHVIIFETEKNEVTGKEEYTGFYWVYDVDVEEGFQARQILENDFVQGNQADLSQGTILIMSRDEAADFAQRNGRYFQSGNLIFEKQNKYTPIVWSDYQGKGLDAVREYFNIHFSEHSKNSWLYNLFLESGERNTLGSLSVVVAAGVVLIWLSLPWLLYLVTGLLSRMHFRKLGESKRDSKGKGKNKPEEVSAVSGAVTETEKEGKKETKEGEFQANLTLQEVRQRVAVINRHLYLVGSFTDYLIDLYRQNPDDLMNKYYLDSLNKDYLDILINKFYSKDYPDQKFRDEVLAAREALRKEEGKDGYNGKLVEFIKKYFVALDALNDVLDFMKILAAREALRKEEGEANYSGKLVEFIENYFVAPISYLFLAIMTDQAEKWEADLKGKRPDALKELIKNKGWESSYFIFTDRDLRRLFEICAQEKIDPVTGFGLNEYMVGFGINELQAKGGQTVEEALTSVRKYLKEKNEASGLKQPVFPVKSERIFDNKTVKRGINIGIFLVSSAVAVLIYSTVGLFGSLFTAGIVAFMLNQVVELLPYLKFHFYDWFRMLFKVWKSSKNYKGSLSKDQIKVKKHFFKTYFRYLGAYGAFMILASVFFGWGVIPWFGWVIGGIPVLMISL